MLHLKENLQFKADIGFVTEESPCFKPTDFPAKDSFVMSIDKKGNVISRYGDDTWNFQSFGSKDKFQFGEYDPENKALFKQLMFYIIYSHLFPGKYQSLNAWYKSYQNIFRACTKHKIKACDISRYPKVIEAMAQEYAERSPSNFKKSIWYFDVAFKHKEHIGFAMLNERGIAQFKLYSPDYENGQTAYIPKRLWTQFIHHFDSILDDFELHEQQLKNLFDYIVKIFLKNERNGVPTANVSPFTKSKNQVKEYYDGNFDDCLNSYGLLTLLDKYSERPEKNNSNIFKLDQFGALLNNFLLACYIYILFYSIMRKGEAASLKTDCFRTESDELIGDVYLLAGETTKTDPDSDDRWVVPAQVGRAVGIARTLIEWKMSYLQEPGNVHPLFQNMNIWNKANRVSRARPERSFENTLNKARKFFKPDLFVITQTDYDEALALTPSLIRERWFKVGGVWNFAYHQFRRTLAVHFAINKVSASSTQLQMKHGTREQQFHYQNNAGKLRLNKLAEQEVVNEYYNEMSRNIASVIQGEQVTPHRLSPVKPEIVRFVEESDMKKLLKAQKNGAIGYRKNILGGCVKQGACEYGGFESIAHCTGGQDNNMCADLVIEAKREQEFIDDKAYLEKRMQTVPDGSPMKRSMEAEVIGYQKAIELIKAKKGR